MLQKRHYSTLAAMFSEIYTELSIEQAEKVTEIITEHLKKDNPRFDPARFFALVV